MKTLTKILSVAAVVALCICLFTLTAFAETRTVKQFYPAVSGTCQTQGHAPYILAEDSFYYQVPAGQEYKAGDTPDLSTAAQTDTSGFDTGFDTSNHVNLQHQGPKDATCTGWGNKEYWFCSGCGKYYASQNDAMNDQNGMGHDEALRDEAKLGIKPLGHDFTVVTPGNGANCTHEGNYPYAICQNGCGAIAQAPGGTVQDPPTFYASIDDTIIKKSGHDWTEWEVIKPQTNVSPGQEMRYCQICKEKEYREIWADGIFDQIPIYYVVATRDTWLRGEEPLTFESNLVEQLNNESGKDANFVGVRIGTDSLYENSYDTFDFWSWDGYVKLGEKTMAGLREGTYRLWIYDKRHPDVFTNSAVFYVVDVPTLEPYSTDKHVVNSSKSLRFVASDEIDPNSVMVGSKRLYDANDYFVSNDRKNITLSADFLNNRQTGTYTISAVTTSGRTIKTNFCVLTTAQASSSPRTGDESQIGLWAAFLLLSGAAVVVLVPKLRKQGVK